MSKEYNSYNDPFALAKSLIPTTVGFDSMFKKFEDFQKSVSKAATGYPPYNIKKTDENKYVIELAVAGFSKHDLEIELLDNVLSIKGKTSLDSHVQDGLDISYLYKGIADRMFNRTFSLADTVEIKNAELINGMLKIWLENIIPESKKGRKIDITSDESKAQFLAEKIK